MQFKARPDQKELPDHGLLTRFADHAGVSARYLSHINNGRKNIGDGLARQLEEGFKLPHGWMDHMHSPEEAEGSEKQFLEAARQLFRESPVEAQALLLNYALARKKSPRR